MAGARVQVQLPEKILNCSYTYYICTLHIHTLNLKTINQPYNDECNAKRGTKKVSKWELLLPEICGKK